MSTQEQLEKSKITNDSNRKKELEEKSSNGTSPNKKNIDITYG